MFSKKEEFTNSIQFKIGERIEDLKPSDYGTIEELGDLFQQKNDEFNWKTLHFLSLYYPIKEKIEAITTKEIHSETDLNSLLNGKEKEELIEFLKSQKIDPIEMSRPKIVNQIVFLFPVLGILGSMLISTYLITAKDYSGWIYLSGLIGIILSLGLFKITEKLKVQFKPNTLLGYVKSTYVVRYKTISRKPHTRQQLIQFLLDELEMIYDKRFDATETIPEN